MQCKKCNKQIPENSLFCNFCGTSQTKKPKTNRTRANGEGTVYWDRTSWCAEKTFGYLIKNGKLKREYARKWGFKTKKDAKAYLTSLTPGNKNNYTFQDLWQDWSNAKLADFAKGTQNAYKLAYNRLGRVQFRKITSVALSELEILFKNLSYEGAKDLKALITKLYDRAMVDQIVTVNLGRFLELPEDTSTQSTVKLSSSEVDRIWSAWHSGQSFAGLILLLIYTGMMPGELLKLEISMINFDTQTIIGCGMKTKKRKQKPIVFPDFIVEVLKTLIFQAKSAKLYPYSYTTFRRTFAKFKLELAINPEATPYSTRRTTATNLALKGESTGIIIDIMRQTNYSTTANHYNIFDSADLVSAVNKLPAPSNPPSSNHSFVQNSPDFPEQL